MLAHLIVLALFGEGEPQPSPTQTLAIWTPGSLGLGIDQIEDD